MKNILIPTDFSLCAMRAMDLGMALANFFNAKVHFFTTIDDDKNGEKLNALMENKNSKNVELVSKINNLFKKWKIEADVMNVEVSFVCSTQKLLPALQSYVADHDIDFVVMGSHGHSGVQGFYLGSNCQKVVRALQVPVFIIKEKLKRQEFKNVVFASSFKDEEMTSYIQFLDFIKRFEPNVVHLLGINTTCINKAGCRAPEIDEMEEAMKKYQKMCDFAMCKKHVYMDSLIEPGIRHFSENIDADLIVISNHNRHPVKRIFTGSTVEALVQNTSLPVLSIDFVDDKIIKKVDENELKKII